MRTLAAILLLGTAGCSAAQHLSEPYFVLLRDDGYTWCAYKNFGEFESEAALLHPTDSARITYSSNTLTDLTYQVEAESGDWIVIDKYTSSSGKVLLRRANLLAQENLQIIQETTIESGSVRPFQIVSVSTLAGKPAKLSDVDFPVVPVTADPQAFSFLRVVAQMRNQSIGKLCQKVEDAAQ